LVVWMCACASELPVAVTATHLAFHVLYLTVTLAAPQWAVQQNTRRVQLGVDGGRAQGCGEGGDGDQDAGDFNPPLPPMLTLILTLTLTLTLGLGLGLALAP